MILYYCIQGLYNLRHSYQKMSISETKKIFDVKSYKYIKNNYNKRNKMTTIYVLKLENDKYYIGKTNKKLEERFQEHLNGEGSEWTKIHKPIEIIEYNKYADDYDEDKYTKKYMNKYGIDNVRGGSYVTINLPDYQIKALQTELKTLENKCFNCRATDHYIDACPSKGLSINRQTFPCLARSRVNKGPGVCLRESCFNKQPFVGPDRIAPRKGDEHNFFVGSTGSSQNINLKNNQINKNNLRNNYHKKHQLKQINNKCYRCQRKGHWADECYAKTDINGKYIVDY